MSRKIKLFIKTKNVKIFALSVLTASLLLIIGFLSFSVYAIYNGIKMSKEDLYSLKPSSMIFYDNHASFYNGLYPYIINNVNHNAFYYTFVGTVIISVALIIGMFFYFYKLILKADNLELSMSSIEKNVLEIPSLIFHEVKGNLNALSINSKLLNHKLDNLNQLQNLNQMQIDESSDNLTSPMDAEVPAQRFAVLSNAESGIKKISQVIEAETSRLNLTMENIIRFTKNLDLYLEDIDIKGLIKESVGEVSSKASHKNIELKIKVSENIIVRMDNMLMKHALINLISNAIDSYSSNKDGIVYIYSSFYLSKAVIIVEDMGRGMSKKEIKKVFDPFFTTKKSGIGLGLSFVKKIIDAHNFSIDIQSVTGKGTKVFIYLDNVFN